MELIRVVQCHLCFFPFRFSSDVFLMFHRISFYLGSFPLINSRSLLPPVPALLHCVKGGVCVVCSVQAAYHILPDFSTAPFHHQKWGICVQHLCTIWWEEFPRVSEELWFQEICLPRVHSWKPFRMWFSAMKSIQSTISQWLKIF